MEKENPTRKRSRKNFETPLESVNNINQNECIGVQKRKNELNLKTCPELKDILRSLKEKLTGRKSELIDRILQCEYINFSLNPKSGTDDTQHRRFLKAPVKTNQPFIPFTYPRSVGSTF